MQSSGLAYGQPLTWFVRTQAPWGICMTKLPARSKRNVFLLLAIAWLVWATIQGILGFVKNGNSGVHQQLVEFLLMHFLLAPVFAALYGAEKLEKRLKIVFPTGASFVAITVALVISLPIGFYLLIQASKYF